MANLKEQINEVGKKVGECVSNTADWVKEKTGMGPGREEGSDAGLGGIRQHMEVLDVSGQKRRSARWTASRATRSS